MAVCRRPRVFEHRIAATTDRWRAPTRRGSAVGSALGLPDEYQPEGRHRRTITGPLDLIDHEARLRPFDRSGALTDPEQTHGKRKDPDNEKRCAHGFLPRPFLALDTSRSFQGPCMRQR